MKEIKTTRRNFLAATAAAGAFTSPQQGCCVVARGTLALNLAFPWTLHVARGFNQTIDSEQ